MKIIKHFRIGGCTQRVIASPLFEKQHRRCKAAGLPSNCRFGSKTAIRRRQRLQNMAVKRRLGSLHPANEANKRTTAGTAGG